jgi:hypothetical protein
MSPRAKLVIALLLVLSIIYFAIGSLCALHDSRDFASVYVSSRAWLKGFDPYDQSAFPTLWSEARGSPAQLPDPSQVPPLYPLTTLLLISPFALFSWQVAKGTWLVVNLVAVAVTIGALFAIGGMRDRTGQVILVTGTLALWALQSAIWVGSPTIITLALGMGSIFLGRIRRDCWAGITLGLCLCLKPHLALPFLAYYLFVRRRAVLYACLAAVCVIMLAALIRTSDFSWLWGWLTNIRAALNGGVNDPTGANPLRWQLLNLSYPLHTFISSRLAVTILVFVFVAGQLAIFAKLQHFDGTFPHDLAGLCCLTTISFFPVYHRLYDAALLVLLIPLVVRLLSHGNNTFGRFLMYLLFMFVPSPALLNWIEQYPYFESLAGSWWWTHLIKPWQAWSLLVISIVLLCLMYSERDRPVAGS